MTPGERNPNLVSSVAPRPPGPRVAVSRPRRRTLTAHSRAGVGHTPDEDRSYTLLDYSFRVRGGDSVTSTMIDAFIGRFGPGPPGDVPEYRFEERYGDGPVLPFRLSVDGRHLKSSADPRRLVEHLVWHVLSEAVGGSQRPLVHAGAVCRDGMAVLLPGPSGAGKTTLTAGLLRAGFSFLSDEFAPIEPESLMVLPFPRALCFKPGSAGLTLVGSLQPPADREHIVPVRPELLGAGTFAKPAPVRVVVAPRYRPGCRTRLTATTRAEGLVELARNTFNLHGSVGAPGATTNRFEILGRVAAGADFYRLEMGDLDDAVSAIRDLVWTRGPGSDPSGGSLATGEIPGIDHRLVVSPGWGRFKALPLEVGQAVEAGTVIGHVRDGRYEVPLVAHAPGRFLRWMVADGERLPPGRAVALLSVSRTG